MASNGSPSAPFERLTLFTFVAQTEVWLIWAIYSVLVLLFMVFTLPIMIVWWIVAGVPFLQFCLNLIESTALGVKRAPRMTWDGFRDPRIYKQLLLSTGLVSLIAATPPDWQFAAIGIVLLVCPAMTAFIALEDSLARALNPVRVGLFIWNMGLSYLALRVVATTGILYVLLLSQHYSILLATLAGKVFFAVASVYLILVLCRCTGALLHSRRAELGIRTIASPEQAEAAVSDATRRERDEFLGEIYKLARADKLDEAWQRLEERLKRSRYAVEGEYYSELAQWEDERLARKMAQGYLRRLVRTAPELAWPILEDIATRTGGNYRLDAGEPLLLFAEHANTSRRRRIIVDMLRYFEDDFPTHPRRREALLTATSLACELDDEELARELFARVQRMRGLIHKPTFDRCRQLLGAG